LAIETIQIRGDVSLHAPRLDMMLLGMEIYNNLCVLLFLYSLYRICRNVISRWSALHLESEVISYLNGLQAQAEFIM